MSTIDIGIADTPIPAQAPHASAPAARPVTTPAPVVVDDGFYVGSVKIEPTLQQPRTAAPAVKAWSR
ncbi:MAG: hypothetical protein WAW73_02870 [Rhodoferax sp.]